MSGKTDSFCGSISPDQGTRKENVIFGNRPRHRRRDPRLSMARDIQRTKVEQSPTIANTRIGRMVTDEAKQRIVDILTEEAIVNSISTDLARQAEHIRKKSNVSSEALPWLTSGVTATEGWKRFAFQKANPKSSSGAAGRSQSFGGSDNGSDSSSDKRDK